MEIFKSVKYTEGSKFYCYFCSKTWHKSLKRDCVMHFVTLAKAWLLSYRFVGQSPSCDPFNKHVSGIICSWKLTEIYKYNLFLSCVFSISPFLLCRCRCAFWSFLIYLVFPSWLELFATEHKPRKLRSFRNFLGKLTQSMTRASIT